MTYQHLKLFLCFGSSCHGVVIGHALHPVPIASLLHIYIIVIVLRLFLAQQERSQAIPVLSLLHIVIAGDHSQRIYQILLRDYDLPTCPSTSSA